MSMIKGTSISPDLLTFAELVASSRFFTTWFLTFYRSWVAAQKTCGLQRGAELRIYFEQCAGDTQLGCFCLSFHATAGSIDLDIIFITTFDSLEGHFDLVLQIYERKILFIVLIVDRDLAFTPAQEHPGYCFFTATNCIFLLFHYLKIRKLMFWVAVRCADARHRHTRTISCTSCGPGDSLAACL